MGGARPGWQQAPAGTRAPAEAAAAACRPHQAGFRSTRMTESPRRNILLQAGRRAGAIGSNSAEWRQGALPPQHACGDLPTHSAHASSSPPHTLSPKCLTLSHLMKRSLFTGLDAFAPLPVFGICRAAAAAAANTFPKDIKQSNRPSFPLISRCPRRPSCIHASAQIHHVARQGSGPAARPPHLGPKLLDVLQHHIAVPVERLHAA